MNNKTFDDKEWYNTLIDQLTGEVEQSTNELTHDEMEFLSWKEFNERMFDQ